MIRRIVWSDDAVHDFDDAIEVIALQSDAASLLVAQRILTAIDLLAEIPTGHKGRVGRSYEKFVQKTSYIVAYALTDRTVTILRIIHGARNWPEGEWPSDA